MKKVAVIMAGGMGAKFWPKSTAKLPKQFTHTMGEGTLLQNTYARLLQFFEKEDIYVITAYKFLDVVKQQLPKIQFENLIFEPFGRHTAPCTALASLYLQNKGYTADTVMCIFPSDHIISNVGEFIQSIETAAKIAYEKHSVVTIGIPPTRPETGYGYIQLKQDSKGIEEYFDLGARLTNTFAEKPDERTAERFIDSGDFVWNSGMFIWRIDVFEHLFAKFLPQYAEKYEILARYIGKDGYIEELKYIYKQLNPMSLDYGILEKAENVYCIQSSFFWSDLDNWDELYRLSLKDAHNNVLEGDIISINNKNSMIISQSGKFVGVVGMSDVIVIDTDDSILICRRGASDDVQELVDHLRRRNINKFL